MIKKKKGCGFHLFLILIFAVAAYLLFTANQGRIMQYFFPLHFREYVEASAEEFDVSPWLVFAVIREESSFRVEAVSPVGAMGLMQLMPATAEWAIELTGFDICLDDIMVPRYNIRLGTWYIDWLRNYYNGDLILTIAAYNAGLTNVDNWLAEGIWDGSLENVDDIPFPETRRYVRYVWESYNMYRRLYTNY